MSDSDGDYMHDSDDDVVVTGGAAGASTRAQGKKKKASRGNQRWERGVERNAAPREDESGRLIKEVGESAEARKRKRAQVVASLPLDQVVLPLQLCNPTNVSENEMKDSHKQKESSEQDIPPVHQGPDKKWYYLVHGGPGTTAAYQVAASEEDAMKASLARRKRALRQDTQPFQRGIIRHVVLVLDFSEAMEQRDFLPNRLLKMLQYAEQYISEFFEQNPISQMCVMGMHDGLCIRITELSGNPTDHIGPIHAMRNTRNDVTYREPKGSPSLQNTLEQARAALYHTPSHGTREVIIIMGALLSLDPGDIHQTIRSCVKDRVRVSIIGMGGRMKICQDICAKTNAGDDSTYNIAVDQFHFRELLMATTTPPVIRASAATDGSDPSATENPASLLMMGFPSRIIEDAPSLCACHGNLTRGGYLCSRCSAKVCDLPSTCPSCSLTLILSTHLARSYHHLFPLMNWSPVSWGRAREVGSRACIACLAPFPPIPDTLPPPKKGSANANGNGTSGPGKDGEQAEYVEQEQGESESSRYECRACHGHFCVDCDLFNHEVVHNCPGCLGLMGKEPVDGEGDGVDHDPDGKVAEAMKGFMDGYKGPGELGLL